MAAAGVHDELALADRAARAQHRDDVGQHVVGDGQQQQVAGARDVGRLGDRDAGQQRVDAATRGVGLTGGGHDLVARGTERGGQDGADAAGADHAHAERGATGETGRSSCATSSFQSRRGYRSTAINIERTPARFRGGTDRGRDEAASRDTRTCDVIVPDHYAASLRERLSDAGCGARAELPASWTTCTSATMSDDRGPGDDGVELPEAVLQGEVAQSAAADDAGDRGHVDQRDEGEGVAQHQRAERLGEHHGPDDAGPAGADGPRGLDDAGVDRHEVLLDDAADAEGGGEREREDDGRVADAGADDDPGERLDGRDEDDERDRPEEVHQHVEHEVDRAAGERPPPRVTYSPSPSSRPRRPPSVRVMATM